MLLNNLTQTDSNLLFQSTLSIDHCSTLSNPENFRQYYSL